jgi:protein-disulfide isomerase
MQQLARLFSGCALVLFALGTACASSPQPAPAAVSPAVAIEVHAPGPQVVALPPPAPAAEADELAADAPREGPAAEPGAGSEPVVFKVPIAGSPVLGPASAPITVIVFSDFQCPHCKYAAERVGELRKLYGNQVRFVFKHYPLSSHPRSEPAAQLTLEARAQQGDMGFWKAHDALFASAPQLDDQDFTQIAAALKLNVAAVRRAVATHRYAAAIEADGALGDAVEVTGTPCFFVNGRKLTGARPLEDFTALIQQLLPESEALVRSGVRPERVYDELIRQGYSNPRP